MHYNYHIEKYDQHVQHVQDLRLYVVDLFLQQLLNLLTRERVPLDDGSLLLLLLRCK